MLAVVGTMPEEDFPLVAGDVRLKKNRIQIGEKPLTVIWWATLAWGMEAEAYTNTLSRTSPFPVSQ